MTFYIILGIGTAILSWILGTFLLSLFGFLLDFFDIRNENYVVLPVITLAPLISAVVIAYALINFVQIAPSIQNIHSNKFAEVDSTSTILLKLDKEAKQLKESLSNPKELRISEIEMVLERTLDFSGEMREILVNQKNIIQDLSAEVKIERQKAEESQRLARQVQSLAKEQLEAIKFLITEDAKVEARDSFYMGVAVSIPIGILASLFASFLYKKIGSLRRRY